MKKVFFEGILFIAIFASSVFLLSQINWVSIFKINEYRKVNEKKIGDILWDMIKSNHEENKNVFVHKTIDSLVARVCVANHIDKKDIQVHILESDEVNAFALPGGHLVIYSSLIEATDNPEELTGVIAHEIAHIQLHHVVKKLIKEIGISAIFAVTAGGNKTVIKQMGNILSSTAFDRQFEQGADMQAVEYLINANIHPKSLADFLQKLAEKENNSLKYLTWVSTHPNTEERAKYILKQSSNKKITAKPIFSPQTWKRLKKEIH